MSSRRIIGRQQGLMRGRGWTWNGRGGLQNLLSVIRGGVGVQAHGRLRGPAVGGLTPHRLCIHDLQQTTSIRHKSYFPRTTRGVACQHELLLHSHMLLRYSWARWVVLLLVFLRFEHHKVQRRLVSLSVTSLPLPLQTNVRVPACGPKQMLLDRHSANSMQTGS